MRFTVSIIFLLKAEWEAFAVSSSCWATFLAVSFFVRFRCFVAAWRDVLRMEDAGPSSEAGESEARLAFCLGVFVWEGVLWAIIAGLRYS